MYWIQAMSPATFKLMIWIISSIQVFSQSLCPHLSGTLNCDCSTSKIECSGIQSNASEIQDVLADFSSFSNLVIKVNNLHFEPDFRLRNMSVKNLTLGYGLDTPPSGFFSELGSSLVSLNLNNNSIGHIDDQLSLLSNLLYLYLDFNELVEIDQTMFADLINLKYLSVISNSLNDISADSFKGLTSLTTLILSHNNLTNFENTNIKSLSLVVLKLDGCVFQGSVSKDTLPDIPNLQELDLSLNRISEIKPHALPSMKHLQNLNLSHNVIEFLQENAFFELSNLKVLDLKANKISLVKRSSFSGLLNLKHLDLSRNRLKAFLCDYTADFASLEVIDLRDNEIKVFTSGAFYYSPILKKLHLLGNNLECSCELTDMAYYLIENSTMERKDLETVYCVVTTTLGYMPITEYKNSKCIPEEPCKKLSHSLTDDDEDYDYDYLDKSTASFTAVATSSDNISTLLTETTFDLPSSSFSPTTATTFDLASSLSSVTTETAFGSSSSSSSPTTENVLIDGSSENSSIVYTTFPLGYSTDVETTILNEVSSYPETTSVFSTSSVEATTNGDLGSPNSTNDVYSYDNSSDTTAFDESTSDSTSVLIESTTKSISVFSESKIKPLSASSESTTEPKSVFSKGTEKPISVLSERTTEPISVLNESTTEPIITFSERTTKPISVFSESTTVPISVLSESTTVPISVFSESTTVPISVLSESTTVPISVLSESTMEPLSASSESTTEPKTVFNEHTTEPIKITTHSASEISSVLSTTGTKFPTSDTSPPDSTKFFSSTYKDTIGLTEIITKHTTVVTESKTSTVSADVCGHVKLSMDKSSLGVETGIMKNFTFDGATFCLKWAYGNFLPPKSRCIIKYTFIKGVKSENLECPKFPGDVKIWSKNEKIYKFCINIYGVSIGGSCTKVSEKTLPVSSTASVETSTLDPKATISSTYNSSDSVETTDATTHASPETTTPAVSDSFSEETTVIKTLETTPTKISDKHPSTFNVTSLEIYFNDSSFAYAKWTVKKANHRDICNLTLTVTTQYFDHSEGVFPCKNHIHKLVNVREDDIFKLCLVSQHKLRGYNTICRYSVAGDNIDVEASSQDNSTNHSSSSLIPLLVLLAILMCVVVFIVYKNIHKKRQESERYDVRAEEEKSERVHFRQSSSVDRSFVRSSYIAKGDPDI